MIAPLLHPERYKRVRSLPKSQLGRYGPVGTVVFCDYWQEHYTVRSHNENGTVTVDWHGDRRAVNPRPARTTTHSTPLEDRDWIKIA
jgi:hypothetical protein